MRLTAVARVVVQALLQVVSRAARWLGRVLPVAGRVLLARVVPWGRTVGAALWRTVSAALGAGAVPRVVRGAGIALVVLVVVRHCASDRQRATDSVARATSAQTIRTLQRERATLTTRLRAAERQYRVDTVRLTRVRTRYESLRDTIRLTDSVVRTDTVRLLIEAADETIRSCTAVARTCEAGWALERARAATFAQELAVLRAAQPSRWQRFVERIDAPVAGVAGLVVGALVVRAVR